MKRIINGYDQLAIIGREIIRQEKILKGTDSKQIKNKIKALEKRQSELCDAMNIPRWRRGEYRRYGVIY